MIVYLQVFLALIVLPVTLSDDACKFVNDDYCFRFGQMPCYQKICECELKNCTDLRDSNDCVVSPWCNPTGETHLTNESFVLIDHDCDSLRGNCLNRTNSNGYCFVYRQNCPKNTDVEAKLEKSPAERLLKNCGRWKTKCEQKYPKHFACKQFVKKCSSLNITVIDDLSDDDSTSSEENRTDLQEQQKQEKLCSKWERKCGEKWPNHYSCRMLIKKCSFQNPVIQPITGLKGDNSTNFEESVSVKNREKIVEQCQKWKKTCARKYPKHFACRQYRRRCKFVDLLRYDGSDSVPVVNNSLISKTFRAYNVTGVDDNLIPHSVDNDEASGLLKAAA